jgi:glycosyltransferase involved in cell wall biosynthesis
MLKPFPALKGKLRVVFISADFPPMANGGIGTLMKNMSCGLAGLGHEVHVITRSEIETVDFEDGTWVHRIKTRIYEPECVVNNQVLELPPAIKDWAGTAKERADFISSEFGRVDVVVSPIWDLEGCCALASAEWKSVVTLHTTYAMSVDTHPDWTRDGRYFKNFIKKMISAEKKLLEASPMLLANSEGLVEELESAYGIRKDGLRLETVPHGVRDFLNPASITEKPGVIRGLFVGRLELRKGTDVLFEVLPEVFDLLPHFSFDVVGDDGIPAYGTRTLLDKYRDSLMPYIKQGRLRVLGKIKDNELPAYYNTCDFFVAPSRFESFGLILAEAMSCGKPVIACRAGGMSEVVGEAGLLAEPGDVKTLREHMITLASNRELRRILGRQARSRYEEFFSVDLMALKISAILEGVVNDHLA